MQTLKDILKKPLIFWKQLGPGLITGAADDDPSGVATYSQTGAQYGLQLVWLSLFTFPLMSIVQEMCARIGMVTGQGLASNIKKYFPAWVLYTTTILLCVANTFNIGADLGAMAAGVQLLAPSINFNFLIILFALVSVALQIFVPYKNYATYLKYLAFILLAYVATGLIINLDWSTVFFHTLIPSLSFSKDQILLVTAILGTTISPYLFYWQTSQEVEEEILEGKTTVKQRMGATKAEIKKMRIDVYSGMLTSNIVMFFIIVVCASTLFSHGITNIKTAADAANALKPLAGEGAYVLFALGIIGTGLLALPVLTGSTAYAIAECFNLKEGLFLKFKQAHAFYGIMICSMLAALTLNFIKLDPIKALIYSAVANGLVAPIILVLVYVIAKNQTIMGEWKNSKIVNILAQIVIGLMIISGIATIVSLFI